MKKPGSVCILIDRNNSTRLILIEDYKEWVSDRVFKAADLNLRPDVIALSEEANTLLKKVKMGLSVQDKNFSRQLIATCAILSPKILFKDRRKINKKGYIKLGW